MNRATRQCDLAISLLANLGSHSHEGTGQTHDEACEVMSSSGGVSQRRMRADTSSEREKIRRAHGTRAKSTKSQKESAEHAAP